MATGLSTLLMLCLNFCTHILDESEGTGSSHGNKESSCGNTLEESDTDTDADTDGDMLELDESDMDESDTNHVPDNAESHATLRKKGSFYWDWEKGGFTLEWANLAKFDMWHWMEESMCSI